MIKDAEIHDIDAPIFLITVGNDIEANIVESKLKKYDIPVIRKHRGSGGFMNIFMGNTIFGVDLFVPSEHLDDAKKIVARMKLYPPATSKDKRPESSVQRKRRKKAWIILLFLAPVPVIYGVIVIIASMTGNGVIAGLCESEKDGIAGAVRDGITLRRTNNFNTTGSDKYLLKLDSGHDGPASDSNPLLGEVLSQGISDPDWTKEGNKYTLKCPEKEYVFEYNPETGYFSERSD